MPREVITGKGDEPYAVRSLLGWAVIGPVTPKSECSEDETEIISYKVTLDCRDYLRFLWWNDGDISREPEEYRMAVHLFGAT